MYRCPYGEDRNASFKADCARNPRYDFGTGEGGSVVDPVARLHGCSFGEAIGKLAERDIPACGRSDDFSLDRDKSSSGKPATTILRVVPITRPKLVERVRLREIRLSSAKPYCGEIHHRNKGGNFFSVGFGNDGGGYESNGPNFKGRVSPKDTTTFENGGDVCLVFEGFRDFLSYLAIQGVEKTKRDAVVLDSAANVSKAMNFLKKHGENYTYLDNDDAGKRRRRR